MSAKIIKKIINWAEIHHEDLLKNWQLLQEGKKIIKIKAFKKK